MGAAVSGQAWGNRSATRPAVSYTHLDVYKRQYEDLTETSAAEVLGVSVGTVRSQTWKGLRRLEAVLGSDDEEGAHRG